ncbi:MAG: enoyl-CoA hydratase/isomerase family protein [Alphaproteobacteria bacterium]|jgi:3-hydroxyacyl-CoA dehydrogenase|uniref:3-hydroxyacyl-CoA dehydrogenase NAD-binding domain-containing protein n=1 Tax=Brevundimonas sp. TaxID=1871086 RepID=UPI0012024BE4|nr:enoyl-CoA hydratase/isomerase family protein [Alphaproteobacteria bacterium]MBU2163108.1 enoyl-CoA hydratase/isomerase family protein [Alphaproteobacteria bacterium]MBU2231757.1 enoyl-CoA hydratase/isomerase family protein [Alphaproteobacteria bacterium]TAJ43282.1 MAG: 3-hydroxyacyl-CoA dehydrogenase [Brevundimonas sp.]
MTTPIRSEREGDVLVVVSDNPPVNALGAAVRQGLLDQMTAGLADPEVKAIVLRCNGRTFFAGADISEFGKPFVGPDLLEVIERIESGDKPVVAAIHGTALGGGCEVALGCHYRIATASARLGTPEVKLGLLPGAGGTQRIPRIAGVALALEMTALGAPITALKALAVGLVDRVVESEDSLVTEAVAFAREVADRRPLPRASEKTAAPDPEAVAAFRKANARRFRGFEAPETNIACVEAATDRPFNEGAAFERQSFMTLMNGVQSAAQRHIFFAERQAARIDDVPADTPRRATGRVGIIGAGTMGGGIAMNFLSIGIPVTLLDMQQGALDRGVGVVRKNYEATASKGRLTTAQVEAAMGILTPTLDFAALADCDLVIEAVYEEMSIKKDIFARLDAVARPGAILASNTSYLNIDEIASATARPQDVVGLHFFSPANAMKLLEVVRGAATARDVLATAMALAKTIGKVAVVSGVCYGFIGNRMLAPRHINAMKLVLEGATPDQIDRAHVAFGMPMGPFQMEDLAGVDIGWHRDPTRIESVRDALNAEGRWGQKKQAGFYDYDDRRNPTPSPRVAEIIADFRKASGLAEPRTDITDQEIIERTLYPLVNEGALILEEGMAQRPSDIDVVWIYGYGWPVYRGGPMFWADTVGLDKIVASLDRNGFEVASSLRARAESGQGFS